MSTENGQKKKPTCDLYSYKKVVLDLYTKFAHYLCESKQANTYEK